MISMGRIFLSGLFVCVLGGPCWAHEVLTKDSPKLIYVQGSASRSVPVDGVRLLFTFSVEKGTFAEARSAGQEIIEAIRKSLADLKGPTVSFIQGWDLLKQAKISLNTKGRRVDHNVVVELEAVPAGRLHELVAQVIDRSLAVGGKLELRRIDVYLTKAKEQEMRAALFQEATQHTVQEAQGIAKAAGVQPVGPRYLFATSEVASHTDLQEQVYGTAGQQFLSSIVVRKSFKVEADVPDQLELSVSVVGAFEIQ